MCNHIKSPNKSDVLLVTIQLSSFYFQLLVLLLTSVTASPLYSGPRIEVLAPPIPITHAPPYAPAPVYGTPPVPPETSSISPASIPQNQAPALAPVISGPLIQNEGSLSSPTSLSEDAVPIKPPEGLIHIPEGTISIPKGSHQLLLPPGTSISLRDRLGQFSHG